MKSRILLTCATVFLLFQEAVWAEVDLQQFRTAIDLSLDHAENASALYQYQVEDLEILRDDMAKGGSSADDFFSLFSREATDTRIKKIRLLAFSLHQRKQAIKSVELFIQKLKDMKELGKKENEKILFESALVINKLLNDRAAFLEDRRRRLTQFFGNVEVTRLEHVNSKPILQKKATELTDEFTFMEKIISLLHPFATRGYMDAPARLDPLRDPYFARLVSGKITDFLSPDDALDQFPMTPLAFPYHLPLESPDRNQRRRLEKEMKGEDTRWLKLIPKQDSDGFNKLRLDFIKGVASQCELSENSNWEDIVKALEEPICAEKSEKYFTLTGRKLLLKFFFLEISNGKIPVAQLDARSKSAKRKAQRRAERSAVKIQESTPQIPAPSSSLADSSSKVATSIPTDPECLTPELSASALIPGEKRCEHPDDFCHYPEEARTRERHPDRQKRRAHLQDAYQQKHQAESSCASTSGTSKEESKGAIDASVYSDHTLDFVRNLFRLDEYKKGRELSKFWDDFLHAYSNIKYVKQGICNSKPNGSRGNGSVRTVSNEGGLTRVIHDPSVHGKPVGHRLADRIQGIFVYFGWTPESFGL